MKRSEIIKILAEETNLPEVLLNQIYKRMTKIIRAKLMEGNEVVLDGLGKFFPQKLKPKVYTSPEGKVYHIPERLVLRFRPAQRFKDTFRIAMR